MHANEQQLLLEEVRQVNKLEGLDFREALERHRHHALDGSGEAYHEKEE